jgi:hypothetical protein
LIDNPWRAVSHPFDITEIVDGTEDLVGLASECAVFQKGAKGRASVGKAGFPSGCDRRFQRLFTSVANAFEQGRPGMFHLGMSDLFVDLDGGTFQIYLDVSSLYT